MAIDSDWVRALIILVPPVFMASVLALLLRYRQKIRQDGRVQAGIYHLSPSQQLQRRPEDIPEPSDTMDRILLDTAANLQYRLVNAHRSLAPQERFGEDRGKAQIWQQISQIILEESRRGADPEIALWRVQQFLDDRPGADGSSSDVEQ